MQQSLRICFIWADKIAHSSPESHTDPYAIMEWYIPNHSCVWIGRRICASAVTDCRLFCLCPIRSVSLPCDGNFAQRLRWMAGGSRSCATKTERTRRSASLPCDGTRTDAHSPNRKASRHPIGWPFLSCRLGKMRCHRISVTVSRSSSAAIQAASLS